MADQTPPADSLPEGWTVEVRVRKSGKKDKYYTDPVNGYTFQSMKDVLRYRLTGELGKRVFRTKDKENIDGETRDDKISASTVVEGLSLADSSTKTDILENQNSNLKEGMKDEETYESTRTLESAPHAELITNQCEEGSATTCPSQPEAGILERRGGKIDFAIHESVTDPGAEEILPENGLKKYINGESKLGLGKSKRKKVPDLPRRASKRLAGIEIDPPPELKTRTRARHLSARQLGEAEGSVAGYLGDLAAAEGCAGKIETGNDTEKMQSNRKKQPDLPRRASKRLAGIDVGPPLELKTKTRARRVSAERLSEEEGSVAGNLRDSVDETQGSPVVSAPTNPSIPEILNRHVETDNYNYKTGEEPGLLRDLPLKDLWMDPCIEFAVKTLTGAIPIEDHLKADQIPGSATMDLPSECSWGDPCIEFAVKTLTGVIPLGDDFGIEDHLRQQISKSQTGGDRGPALPNVCSDYFSPTDVSRQHHDPVEKPLHKQPTFASSNLSHTRNGSLQISHNDGLNRHCEGRGMECQSQAIR